MLTTERITTPEFVTTKENTYRKDQRKINVGITTITSDIGTEGTSPESDTLTKDTEEEDIPLTEEECRFTIEDTTTLSLVTIREDSYKREED